MLSLYRFSFCLTLILALGLVGCEKSGSGAAGMDVDPANTPCGNGKLDAAELCDPAIVRGERGYCPRNPEQCPAAFTGFFSSQVEGSVESCTAKCTSTLNSNINSYRMTEINLLQPTLQIDLDEDGVCDESGRSMRQVNAALESLLNSRRLSILMMTSQLPEGADEFELYMLSANCVARPGMVDRCELPAVGHEGGILTSATKDEDSICFGAGDVPEMLQEVDGNLVADVQPPCFATDVINERDFVIYHGMFTVNRTVVSATIGDEARQLTGYVHGYLSAEDARSLNFGDGSDTYTPEEQEALRRFFGVQVSSILPGGEGSCGGEDANVGGWWITFSFTAETFDPGLL